MIITEWILLLASAGMGIWTSWTDLKTGLIKNKVLSGFAAVGFLLDIIYYGFLVPDLFGRFFLNLLSVSVISLCLFYSRTFAGGDAKLAITFSLLYPAGCLFQYGGYSVTLFFALGFSAVFGYLYLLGDSLQSVLRKKTEISFNYFFQRLLKALKTYFLIASYVGAVNLLLILVWPAAFQTLGGFLNILIFAFAVCVGHFQIFRNIWLLAAVLVADLCGYIFLGLFPFSLNPQSYLYILIFMAAQSVINLNLYESIPVHSLKSGMILSTAASLMFQNTRFKNLPPVSKENLKNRLSEEQVSAVQRWAEKARQEDVTIVKKIPFAVFLFLGYLTYFVIWRCLI